MAGNLTQSKIEVLTTNLPPANHRPWLFVWLNDFLRRLLDIVAAILGMLILSPVFLLVSIAIQQESAGPIFYNGKRAGKHGLPFAIHKFRTMYDRPESFAGPKVTGQNDRRVTPLGRWLRQTKLNELPQLWNVLRGEMSLVGPRPEDYDIALTWPEAIRNEIFAVRPGITSPASVVYRDEENMLVQRELMTNYLKEILPTKLRLDMLYIRHRTVLSDIDVIFWTFVVLIPRIGKTQIPESLLLWGPASHFFSRFASWFVFDSLTALAAISLAAFIWRMAGPLNLGWDSALFTGLATALAFSVCNLILGMQNIAWRQAPAREAIKLGFSTLLAVAIVLGLDMLNPPGKLPVRMMLVAATLAYIGFVTTRYRERLLTGLATRWISYRRGGQVLGERVLVVGAGDNGSLAAWLLRRKDVGQAYAIIGYVDDDPRKFALRVEGYPVLGSTNNIPELVKKLDIGLIIYTIERIDDAEEHRILDLIHKTNTRLVMLTEIIRFLHNQIGFQMPENDGVQARDRRFDTLTDEPLVPEDQAYLWLHALESATHVRSWDGVDAQLSHIRAELDRLIARRQK